MELSHKIDKDKIDKLEHSTTLYLTVSKLSRADVISYDKWYSCYKMLQDLKYLQASQYSYFELATLLVDKTVSAGDISDDLSKLIVVNHKRNIVDMKKDLRFALREAKNYSQPKRKSIALFIALSYLKDTRNGNLNANIEFDKNLPTPLLTDNDIVANYFKIGHNENEKLFIKSLLGGI